MIIPHPSGLLRKNPFLRIALLFLLLCAKWVAGAQETYRLWKNQQGVGIQAHLVAADEKNVTLKLINGTVSTVALEQLSQADRDYVRQTRGLSPPGGGDGPTSRYAEWNTDLDTALAEAKSGDLPVLMVFTGSDWCPICKELEKKVLSKSAFQTFADEKLVLLKVDQTLRRPPPAKIREEQEAWKAQYGVSGVPTMILTDAGGKVLWRSGYASQDIVDFLEALEKNLGGAGAEPAAESR